MASVNLACCATMLEFGGLTEVPAVAQNVASSTDETLGSLSFALRKASFLGKPPPVPL